jgi:uroporphyrinogen decarboxylase
MDEIIDIGADAKHSFEDKIKPVEEVYERWGGKIGIMGGLDLSILVDGTEADVRKRSREILDACGPGGRFVMGSGNSVANYVPIANYRAMVDETRKWNMEHFGRER